MTRINLLPWREARRVQRQPEGRARQPVAEQQDQTQDRKADREELDRVQHVQPRKAVADIDGQPVLAAIGAPRELVYWTR